MKFFRNPEIIKTLFLYAFLSVAFSAVAFVKFGSYGVFTAALCIVFMVLYLTSTYKRYRKLYDFAMDIDRLLHGEEIDLPLGQYREGELSVLQSKIHKMTLRLLEQRSRLAEDKTFLADSLADISHQIRTPLTSVNLLVHLMSNPAISKEKEDCYTRELLELLSRIDWLITALLKISRLDAGTVTFQKERVPLLLLLQKAARPLLIPMELRCQILVMDAEGNFEGDLSWSQEAIGNILKNCMEHTQKGGQICIKARENALYSEIVISDNGGGIDEEDLPHIFERFYKGKNSDKKGFGIGLALSRMIITWQGGTIKAQNDGTKGALFTIRFYKNVV